jgi:hypothetical protein
MIMALRLAAHPSTSAVVAVRDAVVGVVWAGGPSPSRRALLAQVP